MKAPKNLSGTFYVGRFHVPKTGSCRQNYAKNTDHRETVVPDTDIRLMAKTTKKNIACLEALWDSNLEHRLSVTPILEIVSRLDHVRFTHLPCNTRNEFIFNLKKLSSSKINRSYRILYFAFHGERGGRILLSGNEELSLEDLASLMEDRFKDWIVLFGSCCTLCIGEKRLRAFLRHTEVSLVVGYRKAVDWGESVAFELILLHCLMEYRSIGPMLKRIKKRYPDLITATGLRFYQRK